MTTQAPEKSGAWTKTKEVTIMIAQCAMCNHYAKIEPDGDLCQDCIRQLEAEAYYHDVPELGGSWLRQLCWRMLTRIRSYL